MSKENPESARPVETMIPSEGIVERRAGHVALQLAESIASDVKHDVVAIAVAGAALKVKGALGSKGSDSKSNDSKD